MQIPVLSCSTKANWSSKTNHMQIPMGGQYDRKWTPPLDAFLRDDEQPKTKAFNAAGLSPTPEKCLRLPVTEERKEFLKGEKLQWMLERRLLWATIPEMAGRFGHFRSGGVVVERGEIAISNNGAPQRWSFLELCTSFHLVNENTSGCFFHHGRPASSHRRATAGTTSGPVSHHRGQRGVAEIINTYVTSTFVISTDIRGVCLWP